MELHQHEKMILDYLKKIDKKVSPEHIASDLNMNKDAVFRALGMLSDKKLVSIDKKLRSKQYILGKEGETYLNKGLPEEQVLGHGDEYAVNLLSDIEKRIGLPWAKRKGWIEIRNGEIYLTDLGRKALTEKKGKKLLEKVRFGEELSPEDYDLLLELESRGNIVKPIIDYEEYVEITDTGKNLDYELKKEINVLSKELIKTSKWKEVSIRPYNLDFPVEEKYPGKLHPYLHLLDQIKQRLLALGFEEMQGPILEINFWNCDALFMPSDHPARGIHDVFYVKEPKEGRIDDQEIWQRVKETHENGWTTGSSGWGKWDEKLAKRMILRSQTTAVSARTLARLNKEDLPRKFFTIDRVYRPDVVDARHLPEFNQCEGIVVGEGVNLRHLMGFMKYIAEAFGIKDVRFQPAFFPFTEPSIAGYIKHPKLGWIEAMPGGIFRPEVTKPLGIDVPVLAWGLGIDRLAMVSLGIDDIRMLFSDDLQWLRKTYAPLLP